MSKELEPNQIIEAVDTLRNSKAMTDLRDDILKRLSQHAQTDVPYIPEYLTNAGKVQVINSPRVMETARQVSAVVSSYQTTVTAIPGREEDRHKADIVEKAYALRHADLFTPPVVNAKLWEQLVVGFGLYHLVCGDDSKGNPWSVESPDPLSAGFEFVGTQSMRPTVIGRWFKQLVKNTGNYYDSREQRLPIYDGKNWGDLKLSEDQAHDYLSNLPANVKGQFNEVELYEYDDSEYQYIVGCNADKKTGRTLWSRKSITGGSSYVIVPGYMTGSREMREKLLPHLWAPMNIQNQIDSINTLRFTRSMNLKPQVLMERNPELYKALLQLGFMQPVPEGYEVTGVDSIIELNGKPHFWELPSDEDLARLEASKTAELESYISTELAVTSAAVISDSPVRNVQLALGARAQQQAHLLTYRDIAQKEVLDMWAYSMTCEGGYSAEGDKWSLYAKKEAPHGSGIVRPGTQITVGAKDFGFEHTVVVSTKSVTPQEQDFLVQSMIGRKQMKLATWPQVLEVIYQNVDEQEDALVDEEGYEGAAAYYGPWLQPVFDKEMAERHGILIRGADPLAQGPIAGGSGAPPSAASPGMPPNNFPVPQVQSPQSQTQSPLGDEAAV